MPELIVEKRDILGKKVKTLRENGLVPAELYGYEVENLHISVPINTFIDIYREAGEHAIVDVVVDGKTHKVLIHNVQKHPISEELLNIDFYQVNMKEKVTAHVPLEFIGESSAVKDEGGVLYTVIDEIEVEALPTNLPNKITVDISSLTELDTSITVGDLPKEDTFTYVPEPEAAVVSVSTPREEVEEEPTDELSPEDVVVEGEKKEADGEEDDGGGKTGNEENQTDGKT